jgi:hypothetical protein
MRLVTTTTPSIQLRPRQEGSKPPSQPTNFSARSTYGLSCLVVGFRAVLSPRFHRITSRTFDPVSFLCRDEPPLPGHHWPFGSVPLTHGRKMLLGTRHVRTIRALPLVKKLCCPVPIAMPARDPFASPRQAARTCPREQKQILFSGARGQYASVSLTNASDADERRGLARTKSETHQDNESDYEFNPPGTVAGHVPPCAVTDLRDRHAVSDVPCAGGAHRGW